MQTHKPSRTAEVAASYRVLESNKSAEQRVCYDPFAEKFIGKRGTPIGQLPLPKSMIFWLHEKMSQGIFGYFVARTRHIDEILNTCLENGLEQLVILGAGYDSRAYRFAQLKERTMVFEVDHPATQQAKVTILNDVLGSVPDHVRLVPIDFMKDSLPDRLHASGYDANRHTLFIWEGVTYYLAPDAVDATLAFVNQSKKGNSLIFDYTHPSVINGTCPRLEAKMWRKGAERFGEKLLFGIEEGMVETFLTQRGFTQVKNANNHSLKDLYFHGMNKQREITPILEIVHTTVA